MWRLPILEVVGAPRAFEALRVTATDPELGLFEVDGLDAGIEGALDADAQEPPVVLAGAHVVDVAAVADLSALSVGLGLVLVVDAVEAPVQIVLVVAPRHAGHDVNPVAAIPPRPDAPAEGRIDAVHNRHVRSQIAVRAPALTGLETGAFEPRQRVLGEGGRQIGDEKAARQEGADQPGHCTRPHLF